MKTALLLETFDWSDYERVVVLSPHIDDAALSCGGLLLALRGLGVSRLVITVCCGNPPARPTPDGPGRPALRKGHVPPRLRRAEDRAVMRLLDADFVHLGFADGIYRRSPLTGELVYRHPHERWTEPRVDDATFLEELHLVLRRLCVNLGHILLVVPLGIGHHVDHVGTGRVALRLVSSGLHLLWYEDFPYVVGRGTSPGDDDDPLQALVRLRREAVARLALPFDPEEKAALLALYPTQIPPLFGDDAALREALVLQTLEGRPCEFYWRARPLPLARGPHIEPGASSTGG